MISSDKNLIIFGYNSLTGKLLHAKKCIIPDNFSTDNSLASFFSLFFVPSFFSNACLIFRFATLFYCIYMTVWFVISCYFFTRIIFKDDGIMRPCPPNPARFCTWLSIKYHTNLAKVTFLIKIVIQPSRFFFTSSFIK